MTNKNEIYYKKYLKYKIKYLNLLSFIKNKNKVAVDNTNNNQSANININEIYNDKYLNNIDTNTIKIKPNISKNLENSDRTVKSKDSMDSSDSIHFNNDFINSNTVNILNKYKSIKNKLDINEYNELLFILTLNFLNKLNNYTDEHDIEKFYKKLNSSEKILINSITENELNILKNYSCEQSRKTIIDNIDSKNCLDDNILDNIWKNLVIIEEKLQCKLNENETIKFEEYLQKKPCS